MSSVWPFETIEKLRNGVNDPHRPFRCVLLMPFEDKFAPVAAIIHQEVLHVAEEYALRSGHPPPLVERLDWVVSSDIIHRELWQRVVEADLVFCDITELNPNVLFEYGICAATKPIEQVVLIRDALVEEKSPFNISPIRYTAYELSNFGIPGFREKIRKLTWDAHIAFPRTLGATTSVELPVNISLSGRRDYDLLLTPPLAHRRVLDDWFEFGSKLSYLHSWASIGNQKVDACRVSFLARFVGPLQRDEAWIGIGLRSQHSYAGYGHILYLRRDGSIILCQPLDEPGKFENIPIREPIETDLHKEHHFEVTFDESDLEAKVDGVLKTFPIRDMKKVLGPGLVRFQSSLTWMAIKDVQFEKG